MKNDNFILPEKWIIRWECEENYKIINSYFKKLNNKYNWIYTNDSLHSHAYVTYENEYFNPINHQIIPEDHTEITFDQFREYVLGETINKEPEDYSYLLILLDKLRIK